MTPEELKQVIFEGCNEEDIDNWHGITKDNLDKLLIEPEIIELSTFDGQRNKYWLVADEMPDDLEKGYQVVYDEKRDMFGLAIKTKIESDIGYLVGLYGSFVDALNSM